MSEVNGDVGLSNEIFIYCDGVIDHGDVGPLFCCNTPILEDDGAFSLACENLVDLIPEGSCAPYELLPLRDPLDDDITYTSVLDSGGCSTYDVPVSIYDECITLDVPDVPTDGFFDIDAIEVHQ